jgi:hypothetical protein
VEVTVPDKTVSEEPIVVSEKLVEGATKLEQAQKVTLPDETATDIALEPIVVSEKGIAGHMKLERAFIMLDDFPGEDILDVCKRYYSMLEELVLECERQFS